MKRVFADSWYWIACLTPRTPAETAAADIANQLLRNRGRLVTTEEVLTEVLNYYSRHGVQARRGAAIVVRTLLDDDRVEVIAQDHDSFDRGLALYDRRTDKSYSLTDCVSMARMRSEGITEVLSNDRHFAQEGFRPLHSAASQ